MFHVDRAGGSYKPPAKVEAAQLQQLAEAAVAEPAVQRRMLLSPSKHAPPRRARAVPAPARQATVDVPTPAYLRSTVALVGALATEDSSAMRLPAQPHAAVNTEPVPANRAPLYAAVAEAPAKVSPAEPSAELWWKPASARVGRYFVSALPDAADPAQQVAPHTGGSTSREDLQMNAAWLAQRSSLSAEEHGDDDATVARLRVGISRGGNDGLLFWRLLVELLARRAAATHSPGATVAISCSSQASQQCPFMGNPRLRSSGWVTSDGANMLRVHSCRLLIGWREVELRDCDLCRARGGGAGGGGSGGRRSAGLLPAVDGGDGCPVALAGARPVAAAGAGGRVCLHRRRCAVIVDPVKTVEQPPASAVLNGSAVLPGYYGLD